MFEKRRLGTLYSLDIDSMTIIIVMHELHRYVSYYHCTETFEYGHTSVNFVGILRNLGAGRWGRGFQEVRNKPIPFEGRPNLIQFIDRRNAPRMHANALS